MARRKTKIKDGLVTRSLDNGKTETVEHTEHPDVVEQAPMEWSDTHSEAPVWANVDQSKEGKQASKRVAENGKAEAVIAS